MLDNKTITPVDSCYSILLSDLYLIIENQNYLRRVYLFLKIMKRHLLSKILELHNSSNEWPSVDGIISLGYTYQQCDVNENLNIADFIKIFSDYAESQRKIV